MVLNSGGQCHTVLLEENSSSSCQEQCNLCKYGATTPRPDTSMQTSSMPTGSTASDTSCNDCMDANISLDTESLCIACDAVCSPSHPHFSALCPGISPIPLAILPSWSLRWCPRRIGSNPNRHFEFANFLHFYIFEQALPFAGWGGSRNAAFTR